MALVQGTGRFSTPGPYTVPRWTEEEADDELAISNLDAILSAAKAPNFASTQTVNPDLSLPSLGLGLARAKDWTSIFKKPEPEPAPEPATNQAGSDTNYSGAAVASSKGITAYGYKGTTGVAGTRGKGQYGLATPMADALARANAGMKAAGLGSFSVTDGWRSYESQVATKKKKPGLAATPGRSIHGVGYAADLKLTKAQQQWLYKNGAKYGLYAGAGFSKEPWHWQLLPQYAKGVGV